MIVIFAVERKGKKMSDLIDRQDAIDAIQERINQFGYVHNPYVLSIKQAIREVPSVESEQKTGKWIKEEQGLTVTSYRCSECGRFVRNDTGHDVSKDYPFCHCGAKMEVEG